jgi:hypothetical protein
MSGTSSAILTWNAVVGQSYQVQYKDDLNAPQWQVLETIVATEPDTVFTDASSPAAQRFYRVVVAP